MRSRRPATTASSTAVFAAARWSPARRCWSGTVGGGLLGSVDLAWPFVVRAVLLAAVFVVGLQHDARPRLHPARDGACRAMPTETKRVLDASLTFGWRSRSVRSLVIVSLFQGGFTMWAFYAWQPYFLELLGRDAVWVAGVVSALIALSTIAGNAIVESDERSAASGRRSCSARPASSPRRRGVGLVDSFWPAVVLLLVMTTTMGVTAPVQQAYLHGVVPSSERATVVSFVSLVGSAGGIGGQLGLGYLSRVRGRSSGGVVMLLALPPSSRSARWATTPPIVGRRAGRAVRARQGLPEVAAVARRRGLTMTFAIASSFLRS